MKGTRNMSIGTVLIVDDEQMMRDVVIEMLEDRADKIIPAQNGEEALNLLKNAEGIDVVITDMKMPGMTGNQLLEAVKTRNPGIPVIVMTGYSETFSLEGAIKAGAEEYILKPFKKEEINMIVNRAIWRASSGHPGRLLLRYIIAANEALAQSDNPDKEELLAMGESVRRSIAMLFGKGNSRGGVDKTI